MLEKINTCAAVAMAAFCVVAGYAARPFLDSDAPLADRTHYKFAISNGPIYGAKGKQCLASNFVPGISPENDFTVIVGEAVSEKRLLDIFNLNFNTQYHEKVVFADLSTGKIYSSLEAGVQHVLNQGHDMVLAHATDFPNFADCNVSGGAMPIDVIKRQDDGTYVSEKTALLGDLLSKHGEFVYMVDFSQGEKGSVVEMDIEQAVSKIISVQVYEVDIPPFFLTEDDAKSYLKKFNQTDNGSQIQREPYIPRVIEQKVINQRTMA
ncbi:MAG: hypothetical protein RBR86_01160 [Pseudobdellovibrionaceae bacterium]|jgi:hypothetical protein|nr:hypothetical protein [Pseudobdellovibrionaceae bacterium]